MSIQLLPDLADALQAYAAADEKVYGKAEPVTDLIPFILSAFLQSDRAFARAKR